MKRVISLIMFLVFCLPQAGFAQEMAGIPRSVQTPGDLENWLSGCFEGIMEVQSDDWQTPQDTIRSKKGDCEDFAILTARVLSSRGTDNDMVIISFRGLNISHAICIWKNENGTVSFMSNRKLHNTSKSTIEDAITKYYPDWEKITYTDEKKRQGKVIVRGKTA